VFLTETSAISANSFDQSLSPVYFKYTCYQCSFLRPTTGQHWCCREDLTNHFVDELKCVKERWRRGNLKGFK